MPYAAWVRENDAETIFNRIDTRRRGLSWKVYFDCEDSYSLTALIHYPAADGAGLPRILGGGHRGQRGRREEQRGRAEGERAG